MAEEQVPRYSDDEALKQWERIPQDLRKVVIVALREAASVFQGVVIRDQFDILRYMSVFQIKVGEVFFRYGVNYNEVMNDIRHPFCMHPSQPGEYFFWNLPISLMHDDNELVSVVDMLEENL